VPHIDYDPDAAIASLKTDGYILPADGSVLAKDSQQLAFTLLYPDDELHALLAQSIQKDWAGIGVQVTLQAVSYDSLLNDFLVPRQYQAALVDLDLSRSPDPDPYPFWHQAEATGGQNYSQWDNRTASEYLEQARVLVDQNVRARLYRNFQSIFAKELPALLLYYPVYTYGVDLRVQGVQIPPLFEPSDRFNNVSDWYLVTRRALEQTVEPTATP
jgi:peptide/nickel transport system substrate-binding protein